MLSLINGAEFVLDRSPPEPPAPRSLKRLIGRGLVIATLSCEFSWESAGKVMRWKKRLQRLHHRRRHHLLLRCHRHGNPEFAGSRESWSYEIYFHCLFHLTLILFGSFDSKASGTRLKRYVQASKAVWGSRMYFIALLNQLRNKKGVSFEALLPFKCVLGL